MNEHFVSVKVDREERPDLDALYMDAAVALTGSGGWPLSVFLTPDGEPFWARTYLPPEPRHGLRELPGRARRDLRRSGATSATRSRRPPRRSPSTCASCAAAEAGRRRGRGAAADRRDRVAHLRLRLGVGRLGQRAEVSARARRSSSCSGAACPGCRRRRSTRWRPAGCTTSSAAASTATRSTSAGSCRTSRRCSTTTPSSPSAYLHGWLARSARSATARSPRRRSSTCCASSRSPAAASPRRRTPTPTARRG